MEDNASRRHDKRDLGIDQITVLAGHIGCPEIRADTMAGCPLRETATVSSRPAAAVGRIAGRQR